MNDTPSWLRSTSKVRRTLKQSKTNAVLGGLPPSTDGESEEGPDDGDDSSLSNSRKNSWNHFQHR